MASFKREMFQLPELFDEPIYDNGLMGDVVHGEASDDSAQLAILPDAPDQATGLASKTASAVFRRAVRELRKLTRSANDEFERLLKRSTSSEVFLQKARRFLEKYTPKFAQSITDAQLASVMAGMRQVARAASGYPQGSAPSAQSTGGPPASSLPLFENSEGDYTWPVIDEAVQDLQKRRLLTRSEFDLLSREAKSEAFTVAGVQEEKTLDKIRTIIAERVDLGADFKLFRNTIHDEMGEGTFLSRAHMQTVYRDAVQSAYASGQEKILAKPAIGSLFPYVLRSAINDDRVRPEHLFLSKYGLDGTGIYRKDDPVWIKYKVPVFFG